MGRFPLLLPCGITEVIMVVIEIHTHRQPFAPFPPTKNGIQDLSCLLNVKRMAELVRGNNKEDWP